MASLETITQVCGKNNVAGGKKEFFVSMEADVQTIPDPATGTYDVQTDITMQTGKVFAKIPLSKEGWSFKTTEEGIDSSNTKVEFTAFSPGISENKSRILDIANGSCDVIALIPDKSSVTHLVGELGDAAMMRSSLINEGGKRGYEIKITWDAAHIPYVYTGAVPT